MHKFFPKIQKDTWILINKFACAFSLETHLCFLNNRSECKSVSRAFE